MSKLKLSAYSLVLVSVLKISMLFFLSKLSKTKAAIEVRYTEMRNEVGRVTTFKDSLIYNSDFRKGILGTTFTRAELDSAILKNKLEVETTIEKAELLYEDRKKLGRDFSFWKGIDKFLNVSEVIAVGLMIYFWVRERN